MNLRRTLPISTVAAAVAVVGMVMFARAANDPTVSGVSPNQGPTAGGTQVTITGTNFLAPTKVTFGGIDVTNTPCLTGTPPSNAPCFTLNSTTGITAWTPAHAAGTGDVTVTTAASTSVANVSDQFTWRAVPLVTVVTNNTGPATGGTSVTLTGSNFTSTSKVSFGTTGVMNTPCTGSNAPCFTVNSDSNIFVSSPPHAKGQVDITVTAPGGTSGTSPSDQFTYTASAPTVSGVNPVVGHAAGGDAVTITGTGLSFATTVSFGTTDVSTTPCTGSNAPCFTVTDQSVGTQITVTTPSAAGQGDVTVKVTTGAGTASGATPSYAYAPIPAVTSLDTSSGPITGGTLIGVTGSDFTDAGGLFTVAKATIDGADVPLCDGTNAPVCVTVASPTSLSFTTPPHAAGTGDITVTTPGGTSAAVLGDKFKFVQPAPSVSGVGPAAGSAAGNTQVTVSGTNFSGNGFTVTKVSFGTTDVTGTPCTAGSPPGNAPCFTVASSTSITAWTPAHAPGQVDVRVTTDAGDATSPQQTTISSSDHYVFQQPAPTVTGVSPASGALTGNTQVTVTGTNFSGSGFHVTKLDVGGTDVTATPCAAGTPPANAPCFTVSSASSITLWTPAHGAGQVDITVTSDATGGNSALTSATSNNDHYIYQQPAPTISGVAPANGPMTGGTNVTVSGTNFTGSGYSVTKVTFGTTDVTTTACSAGAPPANAPCFTVTSGTSIAVWSPAHPAGQVDVTVTTNAADSNTPQTSATLSADHYVFVQPAPTVSGISPTAGPTGGGTQVTVIGTNFSGSGFTVTKLDFGTTDVTATPCSAGAPPGNAPCFTVGSASTITVWSPAHAAGQVHVTVTTNAADSSSPLTSVTGSADLFTYVPAATVTSVAPSSGPTPGGTQVTIGGTNFSGTGFTTTKVSFGTTDVTATPCQAGTPPPNAPCYTVTSATTITAWTPSHASGPVDVSVTTPAGTSATNAPNDFFTFVAAPPAVTTVSPVAGPLTGNTPVTITGSGFTAATEVDFGAGKLVNTPCSAGTPPSNAPCYTVNGDTSITAYSPAESAGVVDVRVKTAGGTSPANPGNPGDSFDFVAAPTVTGLDVHAGPAAGGTKVTITGTNFKDTSNAAFYTTSQVGFSSSSAVATTPCSAGTPPGNAPCFTVTGATQIVVWTPAGSPSHSDVTVTTVGGVSTTSSADLFAYAPQPTISALSIHSGPIAGGTSVTVTGTGFTDSTAPSQYGPTTVSVDGTILPACPTSSPMCYAVNTPTSISLVTPAHPAGTGDVVVATAGGQTAALAADHFTYAQPAPTVTVVSPATGPIAGGTQVAITGTNFSGSGYTVTKVAFGATAVSTAPCLSGTPPSNAPCFTVNSATSLTVWSPAAAAGTVDITVTTDAADATTPLTSATSTADHFRYAQPAPAVTSVARASGPIAGGTQITVTGTDLSGSGFTATSIGFGATAVSAAPCAAGAPPANAPCFTVNSPTGLTVYDPAAPAGTVDVTVTTNAADATTPLTSAVSSADHFTYSQPVPTVTSIAPVNGPIVGGTQVAVTGTDFSGSGFTTTVVSFGTTAVTTNPCLSGTPPSNAPCFTVNSPTSITAWNPAEPAGTVHVTVTTNAADATTATTSATSNADAFTYGQPAPSVTGVAPVSGPNGGGTSVTVSGTNFSGNGFSTITLGFGGTNVTTHPCTGSNAPCFTVNSATSLTAVTPAHTPGTVDVSVTTNAGDNSTAVTSPISAADHFVFHQPAPTVTGLSRTSGPSSGATPIVLRGTGFSGPGFSSTVVSFGSSTITNSPCTGTLPCFTVANATTINVSTPAHAAGTVDVTVTTNATDGSTPSTSAATAADRYTYTVQPTVSEISPANGPKSGGTTVTVTGTGFSGATSVTFGGAAATAMNIISDTSLTAVSPASANPGTVDVVVTASGGGSPVNAADQFSYVSQGYWLVASDGGIFPFGSARGYGSTGGVHLNQPIVGMAKTPDGGGYWLVASDGGIFPFGNAGGYGSTGGMHLNQPIVGMAPTPTGRGYFLVASDGGIFPFGDAGGYGSTGGVHLNKPIVGMAVTPDGGGYWLLATDGGIFPFGDAGGYGSTGGTPLNQPIVGMAPTPDGGGYWLVARDGGIFPFGNAGSYGSAGQMRLNKPILGMTSTADGRGYWLVASDGGIFPFGDAAGLGSTGGIHLNQPIVGMSAQG